MDVGHTYQTLKKAGRCALDLVLPPRCPGCNGLDVSVQNPAGFCLLCWQAVIEVSNPCPRCALPDEAPLCVTCSRDPHLFATASAPLIYGGQLAVAIQRIKYGRASHFCQPLGAHLGSMIAFMDPVDLMVPVPLHRSRLRKRGFNQATLLARGAARESGLSLQVDLLVRQRDTPSQAELSPEVRQQNVRGAFVVRGSACRGQRILLVDDVMTTGATASACTLALLEAGAKEVHVLTLARAVP